MTQRESFEKAIKSAPKFNGNESLFAMKENGEYELSAIETAWCGYKIAQAALIADIVERLLAAKIPTTVPSVTNYTIDKAIEIVKKAGE